MLFGGGLVGFVLLGFWVWAIFDVISSDESTVRNLPKFAWLMLVIFLSTIGAFAWLVLGRPQDEWVTEVRDGPRWSEEENRRRRYAELDEELDRRLEEKRLRGEELD